MAAPSPSPPPPLRCAPCAQINAAIEDVLLEAAAEEDGGLDFAAFQALATAPSHDSLASLDQYDARLPRTSFDLPGGASPGGSVHGARGAGPLDPLPE